MKTVGGGLFLIIAVCVLSCFGGTPMRGHDNCRYMPSVEDCQSAAGSLITDKCLRDCIIDQCRGGLTLCGAHVVAACSLRSIEHPEGEKAGYVVRGAQTCNMPKKWVNWCQLPQSPRCQELSMVHERAHACGWRHDEDKGVPGDDGEISGCKSPDH
jgi:hypothetical protein